MPAPTGSQHADLTSIHQAAYVQDTDPGTVGAGKFWVDTSGGSAPYPLYKRNVSDSGWDAVGGGGGGGLPLVYIDASAGGTFTLDSSEQIALISAIVDDDAHIVLPPLADMADGNQIQIKFNSLGSNAADVQPTSGDHLENVTTPMAVTGGEGLILFASVTADLVGWFVSARVKYT